MSTLLLLFFFINITIDFKCESIVLKSSGSPHNKVKVLTLDLKNQLYY